MIIHPKNAEEFNNEIANGTVLVDFFATWCGPCKMLGPVLEELDQENIGVKIIKADVDELNEIAMQYGIQAVPTLILFENGQPRKKVMGYQPKDSLINFIKN